MKTLLILLISFTSYSALACRFGDRQITHRVDSERQECTTSGYCNAYDYNSTTGRYENYYGYHSRCEGVQTRSVDTFYCEDKYSGSRYNDVQYGYWGYCQTK